MLFAPNQDKSKIQLYTESIIAGLLKAKTLSAFTNNRYIFCAALLNFSSSYFSLTNDLTTRIPTTFSWTLSFKSSYLGKTSLKYFIAIRMIIPRTQTKKITATTNTILNSGLIINAIDKAQIKTNGERIHILINI